MFDELDTGKGAGVSRIRVAIAILLVVAAAAPGLLLASHAGRKGGKATAAVPAPSPTCAGRLLQDWGDGRIDGIYPVSCYRAALRSLPADLEIYSSAHDDIAHALSERIVLSRHPQKISGHQGATSARKIASAP
jgi:hypothetical protein